MSNSFFILFVIIIFSLNNFAAQLPRQLSESDRQQTLKILGFGTATKLNTEPTPLGGHQGFEFFVTSEYIPLDTVQKLGNQSGSGNEYVTNTLGFGKGLFYDIDTFVYFSPLQSQSKYSQFGVSIRKAVYTDEDKPFRVSLNFHGNSTSFENLVHLRTTGLDAILSYEWPQFSVSVGSGVGRSIGTFTGGANGINITTESFTGDIQQQHVLLSAANKWNKSYISLQYDRYFDASIALKYGYRLY